MRGSRLAAIRKDLGWSQQRLALELGVEPQMVEDWEQSQDIAPMVELVIATLRTALAKMRESRPVPTT
jgi:transcriptional regulator with XRE-family HTH domain